ncbi:hypothetical protein AAU61_11900 [Desulfocarbo indianensis]|nr:hypothetical protein AAU61_11900 [Desulfocarbo indianensis]
MPVIGVHLALRPVRRYLAATRTGLAPSEKVQVMARRRVINMPFVFTSVSLLMWVLMPTLITLGLHWWLQESDFHTSVFLATRAAMVGLIASTISFFFLEKHSRQNLIPYFFPEGHLSATQGTTRLGISRRIWIMYLVGTLVPIIILLFTLITIQFSAADSALSAAEYGRGLLLFTLVLSGYAFISALRLNSLVSRSVADPLRQMLSVVDRIQKGDYQARVKVVCNDEIGELGDAVNEMIRGLGEREKLHSAFGKYVTPEIRDEILSGRIPLEGERRDATMMFTDLRDFTNFVENHEPEVVIAGMRSYFTAMHRVIRQHRGVVLQFVGDEIEAAFGVPLPYPDHADQAMRAALAMRQALAELNRERAAQGLEPFSHGVGLHSGLVLAGNSGSEEQSAYALIGDTVNVASRIQGLSKELDWDILASRETMSRLSFPCPTVEAGSRSIKGYSKPVAILKVVG